MSDRELMQMVLDALNNFDKGNHGMRWQVPLIKALRARLAQLNDFNPDWDAMAVMVEEQQRMAKRIEELTQLVTSQGIRLMDAEAQPEQEPVAWISHNAGLYHGKPDESLNPLPLYTVPPQREWVGLTDDELIQIGVATGLERAAVMMITDKLKEKNNG